MLLFAYGSNMARAEMEAWCPQHGFLGPARLPGFRVELRRRSLRWGGGAADLVAADGEEAWGALYEVDAARLDGLDAKEGAGRAYERLAVAPELDGRRVAAEAYVVVSKEPVPVPCTPDYAALVLAGGRERGLPEAYLAGLARRLGVPPAARL